MLARLRKEGSRKMCETVDVEIAGFVFPQDKIGQACVERQAFHP